MKAKITISGEANSRRKILNGIRTTKLETTDNGNVLTFKSMQNARYALRVAYDYITEEPELKEVTELTTNSLRYDAGVAIVERVTQKP